MGNVFEYLIDGSSGLVPEGVDGLAMIAGVCSKGQPGKPYLLSGRSDLEGTLGVGPLTDRLRDVFATAGQDSSVIAVPVAGQAAGYASAVTRLGSLGNAPDLLGVPQGNFDVVVQVDSAGGIGEATVIISTDNGKTWGEPVTCTSGLTVADTGMTLLFAEDDSFEEGTSYNFIVRMPIGKVYQYGDGPTVTVSGEVLAAAELQLEIVSGGGLNEGTYRLSVDGGDNFDKTRTIPADGKVELADYGVSVTFADAVYSGGCVYTCRLLAPEPSIVEVMAALETPLNTYDVEFVYIVGPSDSVDWAAASVKADELWNAHRPTYFKLETRLPYENEDLNDFSAWLLSERADFAARFVQVCCQFGEVSDSTQRKLRNWGGLQAGRVISIPVQRATGRVRDGNISQGTLPDGWDAVQPFLEDAGYLTAKTYAGLAGAYWGDSRTLAEDTSDYRYEEVLRTVFKAVRLERTAALNSMYDELGDPLAPGGAVGLNYLKANLENALNTMTAAVPPELAAYVVEIPPNQDFVNNGVAVETTLIGIPIIREIKLYNRYVYAGSSFDPRLEG